MVATGRTERFAIASAAHRAAILSAVSSSSFWSKRGIPVASEDGNGGGVPGKGDVDSTVRLGRTTVVFENDGFPLPEKSKAAALTVPNRLPSEHSILSTSCILHIYRMFQNKWYKV